ncbi:MAG: FAD-dependent thymidylate synthase [Alphaproteobacteria bacterium]|nr:FAD-dependent thymidylate synthase [Alphaproteobacteria bacterium]
MNTATAPLPAAEIDPIAELRSHTQPTLRATVPALEKLLYTPISVLDHGFVRVIDYMGDDSAIVQAARVSYGRGTRKVSEDKGLINYLMRHRHSTPFEMCEIKFHIKLPIFVARQWIRHRTANVNEYSARYSILDREFYLPEPQHLAAQAKNNRQGRADVLEGAEAARVMQLLKADAMQVYDHYEEMLNESQDGTERDASRHGLARELARMNLTLNYYTQWYWKIDLQNLLHFLSLRADAHAQYEIRVYAEAMLDIVKQWVPHTYEAFADYRLGGAMFSGKGIAALKRMLAGEAVTQEQSGMSKGEWREFLTAIGREEA